MPNFITRATPTVLSTTALGSLAGDWQYLGCYVDAVADRTLNGATNIQPSTMTEELCLNWCRDKGFSYAGVEFSQECCTSRDSFPTVSTDSNLPSVFASADCGDDISAVEVSSGECTMACSGNSTEVCGDSNRINVFVNEAAIIPTAPDTVLGDWSSLGCFRYVLIQSRCFHLLDLLTYFL